MADEGCCGCGCGGCLTGLLAIIIWSAMAYIALVVLGIVAGTLLAVGLFLLGRKALRWARHQQPPQPQENNMPTYCDISDRPRKR